MEGWMRGLLFTIATSLLSFSCLFPAHAQTVHFTTEEYPPFNYREGKTPVGAATEQIPGSIIRSTSCPG
jgi:polar amino acid transport system substrate-binding protein